MTPKEQEHLLDELEQRVDRLRVLYDQYFLGFEKLEPSIPRKDVERRFAILRKEQIRNTALRFRFNVCNQKYNTYSMYWTRICRQIEEGTFKRHLQKAKKILEAGPNKREIDLSIDIEMDDFDDMDVDALLAEADASVSQLKESEHDTVPPGAPEKPHVHRAANPLFAPTPGTSFVVTKRQREVLDDDMPPSSQPMDIPLGPSAAATAMAGRAPGAAAGAMPGGPKKLVRRKDGTVGPLDPNRQSSPVLPSSSQNVQAAASSGQRTAAAPAPAPAPAPSTPKVALPAMPGSAPRIQPISAPRVAGAQPPPSTRDIPAAPQSTPRVVLPAMPGRTPAPPNAAGSSGRLPVVPPGPAAGRIPAAPSQGRIPLPSTGGPPASQRTPLPVPPPRQSSGRLPVPPPSTPRPPSPSDPGDGSDG